MYQWLLVRTYLFSKIMPLLASLAVLLCVAMVLVTWSVMGGFLKLLVGSGRTITSDIAISYPNIGFPHYDELTADLLKDPLVGAAAPMIETYALLGLPNGEQKMVLVRGVQGDSYARVTSFADVLWWKPITTPLEKDTQRDDPRLSPNLKSDLAFYELGGKTLSRLNSATGTLEPAAVLGIEVAGLSRRTPEGFRLPNQYIKRERGQEPRIVNSFLPRDGEVTISVLPLDREGRVVEQATRKFPVANEVQSGLFEADEKMVFVRLDAMQELLRMTAAKRIVQTGGPAPTQGAESFPYGNIAKTIEEPARVTQVLVRGKGDLGALGAAEALRARVEDIYAAFAKRHPSDVPTTMDINITTWEDQNRTMISAVQSETGLLLFLFAMISLVAVFLVLAIFWSMIAEKTKDIGVMRALGASRPGIAGVWIVYGLAIGVVGALLGALTAWAVVSNINSIHDWIGRVTGVTIWNPSVYYFSVIPTDMSPVKTIIVVSGGILSATTGAIIPAWRAARMDPVRALRFE